MLRLSGSVYISQDNFDFRDKHSWLTFLLRYRNFIHSGTHKKQTTLHLYHCLIYWNVCNREVV